MKKKFLSIFIAALICIPLVACNNPMKKESNKNKTEITESATITETKKDNEKRFENLGIEYTLPDKWKANENNLDVLGIDGSENIVGQLRLSFAATETLDKIIKLSKEGENISESDKEKSNKFQEELSGLLQDFKEFGDIVTIDKSKPDGNQQKELFSKYENKDAIGNVDNFEFYLLYNKPNTEGLSEKSKNDFEEMYGDIKNFKGLIKVFKPVSETEKLNKYKQVEFKTKTLEGKDIDNSIFKGNKLTMVNVWATFCGPCIQELPDIQKLYEEVKNDKVNIVGIVSDTPDEEELAQKIVSKKEVKFANIIPDEKLKNSLLKDTTSMPTTFFVDSNGNVLGDFIIGAHSKEEYKKEIQDRLKNIQ